MRVGAFCCIVLSMKKIFAALAATIAALAALSTAPVISPASAADGNANGIDDFFEAAGWWDQLAPGVSSTTPVKQRLYQNLPIKCNTNPADRAFEVYYITSAYGDEVSVMDNAPAKVRTTVKMAASAIAASSEAVLSSVTALGTSRSPRFVTDPGTNTCLPKINEVTVPESVLRDTTDGSYLSPTLTYVKDTYGLNNPARKYIFLVQDSDNAKPRAYVSVSWNGSYPNPNNQLNGRAYIYVPVDADSLGNNSAGSLFSTAAGTLAHEMSHSLGAVLSEQPNYNTLNPSHPTDCNDILCYGPGTAGEIRNLGCGGGGNWMTVFFTYRLDCHNDDYFNIGAPSWETTRWNVHQHSAFLWGNPQPTGGPADARGSEGLRVLRESHSHDTHVGHHH